MGHHHRLNSTNLQAICFSLLAYFLITVAATSFISTDLLDSHGYSRRSLLQLQKPCPVNFEDANYTVLKEKCKPPDYPRDPCCSAFKQVACPYIAYLNDATTNCANTMFSYIYVNEHYPPGLFANMCSNTKDGMSCRNTTDATAGNSASSDVTSAGNADVLGGRLLPAVVAAAAGFSLSLLLF